MSDKSYRNHPTAMVQNIVLLMIITFFMIMGPCIEKGGVSLLISIMLVAFVIVIVISYLFWRSASIEFGDTDVIVKHNLLYRKRKTIPYEKIASVNVVRNIYNRIFGTTTLCINVNSSMNAARPDASFVFKTDLADEIRADLTSKMFDRTFVPDKEKEYESLTNFKPMDAILYGLIGGPTLQTVYSLCFFIYSILSIIFFEGSGLLFGLLMLAVGTVIPMVSMVLKYYDLKVYRVDNTIYLQHGMIQTYRSSFDIKKINAIRIREPWIARLMHKCCLEAEVVGINASEKEVTPLLSLLMSRREVDKLVNDLLPEFVAEIPTVHPPKVALYPMLSRNTIFSLVFLAVMAIPDYWLIFESESFLISEGVLLGDLPILMLRFTALVLTLIAVVLSYVGVFIALRINEVGFEKELFKVVYGVMDRKTTTIQYDRVQICETSSSPIARRMGLSRSKISLLSSAGYSKTVTGYFEDAELSKIATTVMERLSNGEYERSRINL